MKINPIIVTQQFESLPILLINVSIIIVKTVALTTLSKQYRAILLLVLTNWRCDANYALITVGHNYASKIHCAVYYIGYP